MIRLGLIRCLLHRAYMTSSDWCIMNKEFEFLRELFTKNGYPEKLFTSCLRRFLSDKYNSKAKTKVQEDGVETMFSIPYVGLPSTILAKKIQ